MFEIGIRDFNAKSDIRVGSEVVNNLNTLIASLTCVWSSKSQTTISTWSFACPSRNSNLPDERLSNTLTASPGNKGINQVTSDESSASSY